MSPQEFKRLQSGLNEKYGSYKAPSTASSGATIDDFDRELEQRRQAKQQAAEEAEKSKGFLTRVKEDVKKRAGDIYETFQETAKGDITPVETGIRAAGSALAGAGDVAGEALTSAYRTFVPDVVKPVIEKGVEKAAKAAGVPEAMEMYGDFAKAHPRAAKNIEAVANIGLNLPGVAGAKVVGETAEVAAKQGAKAAAKSVSKKALSALEDRYSSIVRLTRKSKQAEAEWGKNTARLLAEEGGVDLGVLPDKTLDTYSAAVPKVKEKLDEASKAVKRVIADSGAYGNIDEAERLALKANEANKKLGSVYEKNRDQIRQEFAAIRENYKNVAIRTAEGEMLLPLSVLDDAKSGAWDRAFSGAPLATSKAAQDTDFAIGKALQQTVEDGIDDANIKAMNKKVGDYAEALDVLRNAHGMVLPGGRIGKYAAQATGGLIGAITGGPTGGIAGYFLADQVADMLANPTTRTGYLRKILEKAGVPKNKSKEIVDETLKILKARQAERASRKLLPAPGGTSRGIEPPIRLPESGVLEGQEKLRSLSK